MKRLLSMFAFLTVSITLLTYFPIRLQKLILNPPDNAGCSLHYNGLERAWLSSLGAKREGIKDINNDTIVNNLDAFCRMERTMKPINQKQLVPIDDLIMVQDYFMKANKPVCRYQPGSCLLTAPKPNNLRLWLKLATLDQDTLNTSYQVESSILGPNEVQIVYTHNSRTYQTTKTGVSTHTDRNITIIRICPWGTLKATWSSCPLKEISFNTIRPNMITGATFNRYGLQIDTWNHIFHRRS